MKFSGKNLTSRFACADDMKQYYDWANDELVRRNAFSQKAIEWNSHVKWFRDRLNSDAVMLVFFAGEEAVGQIRVDRDGDVGIIDFSVDKKFRGMHIGSAMLEGLIKLLRKMGSIVSLKGIVKGDNVASIKAFENSGFKKTASLEQHGILCHEFQFEN